MPANLTGSELSPLEEQVGQALVEYLQHRRPRAVHRRVFLQCHAPYGPLTKGFWFGFGINLLLFIMLHVA